MNRLIALATVATFVSPALASLDTSDPSIIVLHQFNEQVSGQLDNDVAGSFLDTAPTGAPQNHDSFADGTSDGPAWGSGAAFASGGNPVGTGTGLSFTAADNDHSRYALWMNQNEGNYSDGGSFTIMTRMYVNGVADNAFQGITGTTSNYMQLQGASGGTRAALQVRVREGVGGGETDFRYDSLGSTGATTAAGSAYYVEFGKWYNAFFIYDANSSVTVAVDDGTTFQYIQTTDIAGIDFDSLTHGFSDSNRLHGVGVLNYGENVPNTFDGLLESIVVFDKALSPAEADAIDLTNASVAVPEPASLGMVVLGGLLIMKRRSGKCCN